MAGTRGRAAFRGRPANDAEAPYIS